VTLICATFILVFTSIEFFDYRKVSLDTSIVVDKSRGEKLTVNLNVTFPRVPCYRELAFFVQSLFYSGIHLPGFHKIFLLLRVYVLYASFLISLIFAST
jgi:hypothetical protein